MYGIEIEGPVGYSSGFVVKEQLECLVHVEMFSHGIVKSGKK